jgi:hypothetical protein
MARLSRAEVIDPNRVTVVHVINRTVRRCFLLGDDPTGLETAGVTGFVVVRAGHEF